MLKYSSFSIFYDNCKSLSISDLTHWGYLMPLQLQKGTITLTSDEIGGSLTTTKIHILVNTHSANQYITLEYTIVNTLISDTIRLVSIPSNIGKGYVWFFICPITGKRCRKLHFIANHFYHRSAFKGCMYEKQSYSHTFREILKPVERIVALDKNLELLSKKHFKRYYSGKPTKRYLRIMNQIK
jgi:hypothetical protein